MWALVSVYLVIVAGGIVRMTGSGMGCPDWPKCFGEYIPPTSADQLPADYLETYAGKRYDKNLKLSGMLESMGFTDLATLIRTDPSIYEEEEFNVFKTYTEYINRLIGALSGLIMLVMLIWSFKWIRSRPIIPTLSVLLMVTMFFQAWFGSIVVSTKLLPGTVSIHMIIALLIVFILIFMLSLLKDQDSKAQIGKGLRNLLILTIGLTAVQVVLGSQVRQNIDILAQSGVMRQDWIENLPTIFAVHRSFSILILLMHLGIVWNMYKYGYRMRLVNLAFAGILLEVFTGIGMAYFGVPAPLQTIHLVVASLVLGFLFYLVTHHRLASIRSSR
jgi:cytochrome c oxidase assembly protein subunit 15